MIICLTKQVKALESLKYNLGKNKTNNFNDIVKNIYTNENYTSYTFEKYLNTINCNYDFKKEYDYIEKTINHIKKNKKKYKILLLLLATTVNFGVFGTSISMALEKGSLGFKLYSKGIEICKIICILGFMVEAGKCVLTGTLESLWRVAVVYCTFMLTMRFLPDVVEWFFTK